MAPLLNNGQGRTRTPIKARRKLSMEGKPLEGKSFYLYLKCSFAKIGVIEKDIQDFGGVVESFLSKSVNYVVTDRTSKESSAQGSSPGQSPYSDAANTSPSPGSEAPAYSTLTRGKLLLQKAVHRSNRGGTDVLANAKAWGVKVVPLEDFKSWIADAKKPRPRKLKEPFIKYEDSDSLFKPSFWQFNRGGWPKICPVKPRRRCSSRRHGKCDDVTTTTPVVAVQESRPVGYCECCLVRYDDLAAHVLTEVHQAYINQDNNYSKVDLMIGNLPDIDQFKSEARPKDDIPSLNNLLLVSPLAKRPRVESPQAKAALDGKCETMSEMNEDTQNDLAPTVGKITPMKQSMMQSNSSDHDVNSEEEMELGSCIDRVMETLQRWDDFGDSSDNFGQISPPCLQAWNDTVANINDVFFESPSVKAASYKSETFNNVDESKDNMFTAGGCAANFDENEVGIIAVEECTQDIEESNKGKTKTEAVVPEIETGTSTSTNDITDIQSSDTRRCTVKIIDCQIKIQTPRKDALLDCESKYTTDDPCFPSPVPFENLLPAFIGLTERIKLNRRSCRKDSDEKEETVLPSKTVKRKSPKTHERKKHRRKCLSW
ncbi:protein DBF4 homolog A-like isoform X2 [Ptychodera flava]|uniref:protein DBF4 homolog A-like isoform X2 n=1 Tax=Ptychodera flava TaxID=63121 RepID=UPI003969EBA5